MITYVLLRPFRSFFGGEARARRLIRGLPAPHSGRLGLPARRMH
ncbi:hypothetical protein BURCENBC7_AP0165 [Burkholderia cenocepacia BC7]|nr:hypothetical protein BURCENK562V_C3464 [Burkholderia cenocepacia K56-2Valvano]ERI27416.1 hypothetical protein BURCENBC7_AP0165 [Burkholderia cenocepacia BC7]CDN63085.1 hypothetical protein I35_5249 [Burkholderia cenocepacia H111]